LAGASSDRRTSQEQRRSNSKTGSNRQNSKRLSIGSLPMSMIGLDMAIDNDPVYLLINTGRLFSELEHHQNVLADLMHNQSAGSFYDEIIKWSTTLQNIEAVIKVWDAVQMKWKRLEPVYTSCEAYSLDQIEVGNFFKTDKDFKNLMKATVNNSNILKCCQRKSNQNLFIYLFYFHFFLNNGFFYSKPSTKKEKFFNVKL